MIVHSHVFNFVLEGVYWLADPARQCVRRGFVNTTTRPLQSHVRSSLHLWQWKWCSNKAVSELLWVHIYIYTLVLTRSCRTRSYKTFCVLANSVVYFTFLWIYSHPFNILIQLKSLSWNQLLCSFNYIARLYSLTAQVKARVQRACSLCR